MSPEQIAFVHGTRSLPRLEYGHWGINLWGQDDELVESFGYPVGVCGPCDSRRLSRLRARRLRQSAGCQVIRLRWVRDLRRRLLVQPGITEALVCPTCGRSTYPKDWAEDTCRDCQVERAQAFPDWDDDPFLPDDEDAEVLAALKELVASLDDRDIRMMSLTRSRQAIAAAERRSA